MEVKTAQAVAQRVIAESSLGADELTELRVLQVGLQLLETGKAKDESIKQRQEDRLGRDLGMVAESDNRGRKERKSKALLR